MEPIINFLYNNDAHLIRKQHYTENFMYHLMEICDRFFVNRLKNIIEVIMIEKMNVKKCGDMLEFAETFNCDLLEMAALEYICQNMARLLENRCLDHLQHETLTKISTHYHDIYQFTAAASDHLIASLVADAISNESILEFTADFNVDLSAGNESVPAVKARKSERPSSDRRNYEKEAIHLVKHLSIETNPMDNKKTSMSMDDSLIVEAEELSKAYSAEMAKWTKVADKKDVKKKVVLAGLKSNTILKMEAKERDNFKSLKNSSVISDIESDLDLSLNSTVGSMDSSANERSLQFHLSLGDFTPQKAGKVSQKQRKRQLSQTDATQTDTNQRQQAVWAPATPTQISVAEKPNAWKIITSETDAPRPTTSTPLKTHATQPICIAAANQPLANDSFFSPTSPSPSTSAFSHTKSPRRSMDGSFSKILNDERKQKEYFNKMKSKSLLLTQMEETAIGELKKFYNVDNVFDEYIEIERKRGIQPTLNFTEWKCQ